MYMLVYLLPFTRSGDVDDLVIVAAIAAIAFIRGDQINLTGVVVGRCFLDGCNNLHSGMKRATKGGQDA